MRAWVALVGVVLLAGCAAPPAARIGTTKDIRASAQYRRDQLVGTWFGEALLRDGGRRQQLTRHEADGSFRIHFRVENALGEVTDITTTGLWGLSGPTYFTLTRGWLTEAGLQPADPTQAYLADAYQVLELTGRRLRYRSYESGNEYTLERVPDGFVLPAFAPLP